MNTFEQSGSTGPINKAAIDDLSELDSLSIRELLQNVGALNAGDVVAPEDLEAIKGRALVLARESDKPTSVKAFVVSAFVDRMKLAQNMVDEQIKNLPDEVLMSVVYTKTGIQPTPEELDLVRRSPLGIAAWGKVRANATTDGSTGFDVAADKTGTVIARGDTPEDAMRKAQEVQGRQPGL